MKNNHKKLVTLSCYLGQIFKKGILMLGSSGFQVVAILSGLAGGGWLLTSLYYLPSIHKQDDDINPSELIVYAACAIVVCAICVVASKLTANASKNVQVDILFTRANTADIPPVDSLIRASEEPTHTQQGILLRVAQHLETPPEQMMRPAEKDSVEQAHIQTLQQIGSS